MGGALASRIRNRTIFGDFSIPLDLSESIKFISVLWDLRFLLRWRWSPCFEKWRPIVWYIFTNVQVGLFCPTNEGNRCIPNVGNSRPDSNLLTHDMYVIQTYINISWQICSGHCWAAVRWVRSRACAAKQYCGSVSFVSAQGALLYNAWAGDVTTMCMDHVTCVSVIRGDVTQRYDECL
jgi:hypothetical protein